ncbi:MAG TPA: glycogen/starch/alpha-glucan phosphorylase, partial [Bacillota bacterium]|nr:glycogen/starch/alpha-glucan phosphorylase [Bacillota bacterium]
PRTFIFGGKAAPSYYQAKTTIKLINTVAEKVNKDPRTRDKLKVVFLENYRVWLAEKIIPAADVSEQISTASKEASGTGNMKFMLNGAVTIGTRDGANIEIGELVGEDNIVFFGLSAEEVINYYNHGGYIARDIYCQDEKLKTVVDQLTNGFLTDKQEYGNIQDGLLLHNDQFFVLKDFAPYCEAQLKVDQLYRNQQRWRSMGIYNIGHSGAFFSDRTISEYAREIWNIKPVVK